MMSWILTIGLACKPKASPVSPVVSETDDLKPNAAALVDTAGCRVRSLRIPSDDYRYTFYDKLMKLAISKMDAAQGPCIFEPTELMSHSRKFNQLNNNKLDIVGNVSSTDLEARAQPVKIPVHMGLHGVRLLVVRKGQEAKFNTIRTLDDLRNLTAGVIHDWQVTEVLNENNMPIVTNDEYEALFRMLDRGRIDYIPLAIFEVFQEVKKRPQYAITVEPTIVLNYPSTDYFFVNSQRPDLRDRLTKGLKLAIADGSRDQLMEQIYGLQSLIPASKLSERQLINLTNRANPNDAPLNEANYWYRLEFSSAKQETP